MTSEDAFFEKLLLCAGVEENYDAWLNRYLETENPLSALVLDLVDCGADRNEVISRLNSYCMAQGVDKAEIETRLRDFLAERYLSGAMDTETLVDVMDRFSAALPDGHFSNQLEVVSDYYTLAERGMIINKALFEKELRAFLAEGKDFDCDAVWEEEKKKQARAAVRAKKKALRKKLRWKALLVIILIFLGICICAGLKRTDEAEWLRYIQHFGSAKTEADALRVLGEPLRIERDFDPDSDSVDYSNLYYDGYCLGIWGGLGSEICCIRIYEKGIMPLRNGIDIGATRKEVEAAYSNATAITDRDGYILTHRNEHLHDGIWIRLDFDDDDRLVKYSVTDGF